MRLRQGGFLLAVARHQAKQTFLDLGPFINEPIEGLGNWHFDTGFLGQFIG